MVKQDQQSKFFDVARPGSTAAHAGSKPVIVGNTPLTRDPMTVENPEKLSHYGDHSKATLQPLEHSEEADDDTQAPLSENPPVTETPSQLSDNSIVEDAANKEELDKLTEQQVYFVHIKGVRRRRFAAQLILLIGAICACAGIGYYLTSLLNT